MFDLSLLASFFIGLASRCKMLFKHYGFKCKCELNSSSNMKRNLMNPLIMPLTCLRERKAISDHSQVFSLDRYSNCMSFELMETVLILILLPLLSAVVILQYLLSDSWLSHAGQGLASAALTAALLSTVACSKCEGKWKNKVALLQP